MKIQEMKEVIRTKNELLVKQTRRIILLEEKLADVRRMYLQLKHSDILVHLRTTL